MSKKAFIFVNLFFFLLISGLVNAYEFSADTVLTTEGQKMTGKIFSKGEKSRMEMGSQGQRMIMISRMDKKVVWNIMPDQKMYMEMPINPKKSVPRTEIKGEIDRKQIGKETIDGHPSIKYLVTFKDGAETMQVHQWMATDIKFPVKSADINNKWIQEFKNIKMGAQPDSLFEIPAGYNKMQLPAKPGSSTNR